LVFFFFNDTATTEIYTLSLHDALPIYIIPFLGLTLTHSCTCASVAIPHPIVVLLHLRGSATQLPVVVTCNEIVLPARSIHCWWLPY